MESLNCTVVAWKGRKFDWEEDQRGILRQKKIPHVLKVYSFSSKNHFWRGMSEQGCRDGAGVPLSVWSTASTHFWLRTWNRLPSWKQPFEGKKHSVNRKSFPCGKNAVKTWFFKLYKNKNNNPDWPRWNANSGPLSRNIYHLFSIYFFNSPLSCIFHPCYIYFIFLDPFTFRWHGSETLASCDYLQHMLNSFQQCMLNTQLAVHKSWPGVNFVFFRKVTTN